MPEVTLDTLLTVLGNPTRRKILEMLAMEKHYPLQLSRELDVSQQAVSKHLKVLEKYGLVECIEEEEYNAIKEACAKVGVELEYVHF